MTSSRHTSLILPGCAIAIFALVCSACSPPAKDPGKPAPAPAPAPGPNLPGEKPAGETPIPKPAADPAGGKAGVESKVSLQAVDLTSFQRIIGMQRGKVVLVDYWATWCEPCKELFPHTMEASRKFPAKDLAVVTMSFDDSTTEDKDNAVKFLEKHKATTINLISSLDTADSFDAYKIPGGAIPFFQLYDRAGTLRHSFKVSPDTGPIDPAEIDLKIRELIMEKEPAAAEKKK